MSKSDALEAIAKLQRLSETRAQQVLTLIHDLAELEALENVADLQAAKAALADAEPPVAWDDVKTQLDAKFGITESPR